jgi:hypothetical protein
VRSIQTHISWVFIASPFVFKVKKPVDLGFLDFSTLEKRHYFCRRELELNRRLCPDAYLAVMPIYESDAGFSFDDENGEIAEYTVKMRELPHGWFLNELLAKGVVGETAINRVIARLGKFYAAQIPRSEVGEWGRPEKIKISTDENFTQVEPFTGKIISPVALQTIRHFTNNFYVANERLFRERITQHRILDCHGDLHLDHVHLTPETTTIFDCIEFNDRFRFIDIVNDLAFLAMDFDFEGKHELGNLFLRNAASEFHDPEMPKLADFYKCYRAFVRGKVECMQANSDQHAKRASRYFRLALRYATVGSEPLVLVVMGRIATGKSTVAKLLAHEFGWPAFSSDRTRKTLAGIPLTKRTAPELRGRVYSEKVSKQTYATLVKEGLAALATHNGVVLDATFSSRAKREILLDACSKAGVRLQVIELEADQESILTRLRAREKNGAEISDARLEDFEKLAAAFEPPSELVPRLIRIATADDVSSTIRILLLRLAEEQSM